MREKADLIDTLFTLYVENGTSARGHASPSAWPMENVSRPSCHATLSPHVDRRAN